MIGENAYLIDGSILNKKVRGTEIKIMDEIN